MSAAKEEILDQAYKMAANTSLNEITIGSLAKASGRSKSGLFGHFKSKENLQLATIEYAERKFIDKVLKPIKNEVCSIQKLHLINERWLQWYEPDSHSCFFIAALMEYRLKDDEVAQMARQQLTKWLTFLTSQIELLKVQGELPASVDAKQFSYEWYSLYCGNLLLANLNQITPDNRSFLSAFDALVNRFTKETP